MGSHSGEHLAMLRLSDLARAIPGSRLLGDADPLVSDVTNDSREVKKQWLFVAIRGLKYDGHQYISAALDAGASAVASASADELDRLCQGAGRLLVPDDRVALALAANELQGYPSASLRLVAVTGTNGKTTMVNLTAAVMDAAGVRAASLGTLGLKIGGEVRPDDRTTPEAPALQRTLRELVREGIRGAAMEVSSHALDLERTLGCRFDVAVFTNLTQDHLDYHPSMEEYYQTKRRLFVEYPDSSPKPMTAVVNVDDPYGSRLSGEAHARVLRFGLGDRAELRALDVEVTATSVVFTAAFENLRLPVRFGAGARFNVYNALGVVGVGLALGLDPHAIATGIASARPVDGRFESVECGQPFTVIVDYAHSPDGLTKVLHSAREIAGRRLLVVFGCGGDRDPIKRPIMGRIVAELADRVIVTSDNPRTECPDQIIGMVVEGIPDDRRPRGVVEPDRRSAIALALEEATPGDVVVVAGKGHENYQIFADRTIHFDDREVVRELLEGKYGPAASR